MNVFGISLKNLVNKPLSSLLSLLLFSFGVGIILLILLTHSFLKKEINENTSGIDLVVGAKGSPLQLILANVFHVDFPTGNIDLKEATQVSRNRLIKQAIPLSLGDSYKGFRVVGTTAAYTKLYDAEIAGDWDQEPMGAIIGHTVAKELGLSVGDTFTGAHGMASGGIPHEAHPFKVKGKLKVTGKVIDRLILVSIPTVWQMHDEEKAMDTLQFANDTINIPWMGITVGRSDLESRQITSMLIKYASPMGAVMLPRQINENSNFQAASPAFETARLFNLIGSGVEVVNALGLAIILLSAISVFIALFNSLKERKYELAIMRAMGAGRWQLLGLILSEGLFLTFFGTLLGWIIAHVSHGLMGQIVEGLNTSAFYFVKEEVNILVGSLVIGFVASLIPGWLAYKVEISKTLAEK